MSSVEMLALGTTIGVAHSFEADHVAAVASLVDEENSERAGLIGTSWGVGHAIPIAAIGLLFLLAGSRLPDVVALVAEAIAGLVLVVLGARVCLDALETTQHTHDGHTHTHLSIGSLELGSTHSHRGGESFLVGIVHGLAGSGVAIGALAADASILEGVSLLGAFAAASIATMGTVALLWGTVLSRTAGRALQAIAGVVAIVVGALLLATEVVGLALV